MQIICADRSFCSGVFRVGSSVSCVAIAAERFPSCSSAVLYFRSDRFSITNDNGRSTLTIRDVKDMDQGAYTCEAINAKGLVFGIPDGVLTLTSESNPGADTSPLNLLIPLI